MMSRKGISPLLATVLLIGFSVLLGAAVMSWGEAYVEDKAEFVQGVQEIRTGCEFVSFEVVKIGGEPQICAKDSEVSITLENGPFVDLSDLKASVIGVQGVTNRESTLISPATRSNVISFKIPTLKIGAVRQIRLTPKIKLGDDVIHCADKVRTFENIRQC